MRDGVLERFKLIRGIDERRQILAQGRGSRRRRAERLVRPGSQDGTIRRKYEVGTLNDELSEQGFHSAFSVQRSYFPLWRFRGRWLRLKGNVRLEF
jgi:hypothetical protein